MHSSAAVHAAPSACFVLHSAPLQYPVVGSQSASVVQVDVQLPPVQSPGAQAMPFIASHMPRPLQS